MRSTFVFILVCVLSMNVHGQYPLMASQAKLSIDHASTVHSLNGGTPMLIFWNDTGFVVRQPDMSVYRQVVHPPPPPGYTFNANVSLITETLFDTDASTIEYMLVAYTGVPGTPLSSVVLRDDGTIIQFFTNESQEAVIGTTYGMDVLNGTPVFNMAGGAYLMLDSANVKVKLYQLPGTFPCYDCTAEGIVIGQQESVTFSDGGMLIFPVPARNEFTVVHGLHLAAGAKLLLHDADGRLVRDMPLTVGATTVTVDTVGLAAGAYTCTISSAGKLVSRTLVVER